MGLKLKGFSPSDYSSNLLNNVLLPSFSAAAEIPSFMTQASHHSSFLPLLPFLYLSFVAQVPSVSFSALILSIKINK